MDHFLERHTREHYAMNHAAANSMFPEGTTADDVAALLGESLAQVDALKADASAPRSNAGKLPQEVPLPGRGIWVQVVLREQGNPPNPHIPIPNGQWYVDQFFPLDFDTVKNTLYARGAKYQAWFDEAVDPDNGWSAAPKPIETLTTAEMVSIANAIRK